MTNDERRSVVNLAALAHDDLALGGGKARNLGELLRAGFPVPPGFCVTTEAWREAIGARLEATIATLEATAADDLANLEAGARAARATIESITPPPALDAAIRGAYAALGADAVVAVRSSATAEDLPDASFAGQQDTFLGVVGADAVIDAVIRCWASLFSDRAVAYRSARGIGHRGLELAVVVQVLIPAAIAGVVFTADPVSGRRDRAVIEASPGLGEAVVSGAVTPDRFVVDEGSPRRIVERSLGDRQVVIEAIDGGGTRRRERGGDVAAITACLDDAQVLELAALARRVEAHYGGPQDLEFAFAAGGALHLLQARPITTLYPLPRRVAGDDSPLRVYFNFNVAQGVLQPLTPMGRQCWRLLMAGGFRHVGVLPGDPLDGPFIYNESAERVMLDLTDILRSAPGRRLIPAILQRMEARSRAIVVGILDDPRLSIVPASTLSRLGFFLRFMRRTRAPIRLLHGMLSPKGALRRAEARLAGFDARRRAPLDGDAHRRLDAIADLLLGAMPPLLFGVMPVAGAGFLSLQILRRIFAGKIERHAFDDLLRALPNNPTTAMDLELFAVAERIAADPESSARLKAEGVDALADEYRRGSLPRPLQDGLRDFLAHHGERGVAEIDVGVDRWRDDPRHLIGTLRGYLDLVGTKLAPDQLFARGEAQAAAIADDLAAKAGFGRRWLVRRLCARVRALTGIRERPKLEMVRTLDRVRSHLAGIAEELVAAGRLAAPEDVYFVDLRELHEAIDGADLRPRVAERRAIRQRELGRRHLPRILLSDGTEPTPPTTPGSSTALHGMPASAGTIEAAAAVIRDPVGARLPAGAILVAPATDPGWTPLFLGAGGLVMEMGGAMSHGAVVAREYGIPAVVGVPQATERIRDGQTIVVDGSLGTVEIDR